MALILYPAGNADSFVSLIDADTYISLNSVHSDKWMQLTTEQKEVYLRIAFTRLHEAMQVASEGTAPDPLSYDPTDTCLPRANAMMAVFDLAYGLSSEINPNTGVVIKERVEGAVEVSYAHTGYRNGDRLYGRVTDPFPADVKACVKMTYGITLGKSGSLYQVKLEHS